MPRRNRRRPQGDPSQFVGLTRELHNHWYATHPWLRPERPAPQPAPERVSFADARAKLAKYLVS